MSHSSSAESPETLPIPKMKFWTKMAFGAGDLGTAMTVNILVFFLLFFLTTVAGLPPGLAASVPMVGKIWDAVNDPIIGVLSDRTRHPWGRRYPWMVFGAIPFGLFFFLLWIVPSTDTWVQFWYYVLIAIAFHTAYTAVNLPYATLTPDLTRDYNERTTLNGFRFSFSLGGSIFSLILAQIIFAMFPDDPGLKYMILGLVCSLVAVPPIFWCVLGTRARVAEVQAATGEEDEPTTLPLSEQVKIAFSNRPFLFVIGIYLFSWLAVQLTASILQYFVVYCMDLPEATFPQVAIAVQGTALVALFPWSRVSERYGRRAVYLMGMGLWIIAQAGLFFLRPGQVGLMYILAIIAGLGVSTAYLVPWSMITDVIDYDELNTGERREGIFYSFMVLLQKMGLAIGIFLVGKALDIAGFVESVSGQEIAQQPDSALLAIRIAIGPLPTVMLIIGIILTYFYPITRQYHEEILLQLQERKREREA
ncbi:MFS transporter [Lyngbya sp. CCY1209]|uniref:MFS transporter n=1 Tax=Lyngbya sp. CCY1209 TaxID=2886103 RepID=UPI002D1FEA14|nr:MFS transporter [Lyngbya sp. CCY1209]MEB3885017.1 MFS transporter [Lyngbya sp. CCY1209]